MVETVISLLITVLVIALVVYLIIWVLGIVGIVLPPKVIQILWVIFALLVILFLYRALVGAGGLHFSHLHFSSSYAMSYLPQIT
jgi:hypothetical protein